MEVLRCICWSNYSHNSSTIPRQLSAEAVSRPRVAHRYREVSAVMSKPTSRTSRGYMIVPPPAHPTYDLKAIINLALAEDAGDRAKEISGCYEVRGLSTTAATKERAECLRRCKQQQKKGAVSTLGARPWAARGDVSCLATIPVEREAEAHFLAKEDGVIAGIAMAIMVFEEVDPQLKVDWSQNDGDLVERGLQFGSVYGSARSILVAERVALNFMQRMSGIATLTKAMADAARPARVLETRKTAPALRLVDKWAVLIGGGENHRMGLFDMVMLKDNHISVAGGIANAIESVEQYLEESNLQMAVEVETRTLEEVKEVLSYRGRGRSVVTRIMLDNMIVPLPNGDVDVSMLKEAVQLINGRFETEASGNVTLNTIGKIGATGVTFISSGALTHSVKALDISLKIDTELALAVGRRTNRA